MAQSRVTSFYNTRKRRPETKLLKSVDQDALSVSTVEKGCSNFFSKLCDSKAAKSPVAVPAKPKDKKVKIVAKTRVKKKNAIKLKSTADIRSMLSKVAEITEESQNQTADGEQTCDLDATFTLETSTLPTSELPILRTPKRNLSDHEEPKLDSKKKKHNETTTVGRSPSGLRASSVTPTKEADVSHNHHPSARKKLDMSIQPMGSSSLNEKLGMAIKTSETNQLYLSSGKLDDLKERLQRFDSAYQKLKDFQSNKFKITSVITSAVKESKAESSQESVIKPSVPAYEKFSSLAVPGPPSLILPYKYRSLSESFRCSDTVVGMLHNRKEVCTFDKLKGGIQDMTKRSFSKSHLGQIKTVFPSAYDYNIEKVSSAFVNRNPGSSQYQLVISPNLKDFKSDAQEPRSGDAGKKSALSKKTSKKDVSQSGSFVQMTPACLVERRHLFGSYLLNIVKRHHQNFLSKLSLPIVVPADQLTKWHPKFRLDCVPDVEQSSLPEAPDVVKVNTAKDALKKIRGTAGEKIEKALASVASKYSTPPNEAEKKGVVSSGLLKGISADLLQRIRARESVKILTDMTTSPTDKKRVEMLERIPELVRILRTYFITERKAAVSLEDATKKLTDSYHSILSPDEVQQHLQLMSELFPTWLSLIPIRKGFFLKIDKNKDINLMLANMPRK